MRHEVDVFLSNWRPILRGSPLEGIARNGNLGSRTKYGLGKIQGGLVRASPMEAV